MSTNSNTTGALVGRGSSERTNSNGTVIVDDRTPEQRKTHRLAIVASDHFMSGWGRAESGTSRCAWACHPDVNTDLVWNWVKSRKEMRYVNLVNLDTYRPPKGTAHFHIYVCNPDHAAAMSDEQQKRK